MAGPGWAGKAICCELLLPGHLLQLERAARSRKHPLVPSAQCQAAGQGGRGGAGMDLAEPPLANHENSTESRCEVTRQ